MRSSELLLLGYLSRFILFCNYLLLYLLDWETRRIRTCFLAFCGLKSSWLMSTVSFDRWRLNFLAIPVTFMNWPLPITTKFWWCISSARNIGEYVLIRWWSLSAKMKASTSSKNHLNNNSLFTWYPSNQIHGMQMTWLPTGFTETSQVLGVLVLKHQIPESPNWTKPSKSSCWSKLRIYL